MRHLGEDGREGKEIGGFNPKLGEDANLKKEPQECEICENLAISLFGCAAPGIWHCKNGASSNLPFLNSLDTGKDVRLDGEFQWKWHILMGGRKFGNFIG